MSEEHDQTDLGASDDRPLGPDHPVYQAHSSKNEDDYGDRLCEWGDNGLCRIHPTCDIIRKQLNRYEQQLEIAQQEVTRTRQQHQATKECYDALVKSQKRTIQTFELGAEVYVVDSTPKIKAKITSVLIDRAGVKYYITWWDTAGLRREERVDQTEVELVQDTL